eukprot:CAMPEP_0180820560 /NCGR_PEP_ID=MMETSP1038_2-20121128/70352_1 /TAXON_ID=632150 /ORGANISM="Azadinium spinosum, Strain 3D9" /LENGTH=67 /DNA_ID=CAMNT_0022862663 /DNA_START=32 /DNA_END=232 /DNA_ORIENTATION=+
MPLPLDVSDALFRPDQLFEAGPFQGHLPTISPADGDAPARSFALNEVVALAPMLPVEESAAIGLDGP